MSRTKGDAPLFRERFDWSTVSPTVAVLESIADLEGVDPVALSTEHDVTLYQYVDPEALDALVDRGRNVTVSFAIDDYVVRIDGDELTVDLA